MDPGAARPCPQSLSHRVFAACHSHRWETVGTPSRDADEGRELHLHDGTCATAAGGCVPHNPVHGRTALRSRLGQLRARPSSLPLGGSVVRSRAAPRGASSRGSGGTAAEHTGCRGVPDPTAGPASPLQVPPALTACTRSTPRVPRRPRDLPTGSQRRASSAPCPPRCRPGWALLLGCLTPSLGASPLQDKEGLGASDFRPQGGRKPKHTPHTPRGRTLPATESNASTKHNAHPTGAR